MSLRRAATVSAVRQPLSSLPRTLFPPLELRNAALKTPQAVKLSPDEWASLQNPSPSAVSALSARLRLDFSAAEPTSSSVTPSSSNHLLEQALTHPSCLSSFAKHYPDSPLPPSNQSLAAVGNGLLGLFAAEHVHTTYPHLPNRVAKAAVSAFVGPRTLADVAKEWGTLPILRWSRTQKTTQENLPILQVTALASIPRAIVALISQHISFSAARKFTHDHFLSRIVDLEPLLKFTSPKIALSETVAKFGRERPISRLLKETGRHTNTPMFVVGIYSGADKLGEGFGHSLKMAETRAAEDALNRLYLTQQPAHLFTLPTSTFPSTFRTGMKAPEMQSLLRSGSNSVASGSTYLAPELGESEALYASSGRSGTPSRGSARTTTWSTAQETQETTV